MSNYEQITFANIEKYRSFETIAKMDEKIYEYIEVLRNDEQPESVIEVLRFLGRSSLRVIGVSFAKYQTIAESIGMSKRTVIRAVNKLAGYGMIERIPTVKKWTGFGKSRKKSVNIIVVNSSLSPEAVTANNVENDKQNKVEKSENAAEPVNYNHYTITSSNTYCIAIRTPYKRFKDAVKQFVGKDSQRLVSRLYGVFRGQTKELRKAYEDDELIDVAIQAIRETFHATKRKKLRNIAGYFNGILSNMLDRMGSELMANLFA
ncbi:helix-turn-helix domain-containing protein [Lentibacillus daqui]|uniref:helix-turn-helix domain-containing protein n=1 Tax=Lentibacillus daqui TaxID=2911514 RepID=UPI0022B09843|nr:helix-turn-helix domain-containing protein [Lentibacillus daqui]